MNEPIDSQLPQNLDAEKQILGSMLYDAHVIDVCTEHLSSDDFYNTAHQKIFDAMVGLFNAGKSIDVITVSDELTKQDLIESVGGAFYLTGLYGSIVSTATIEQYVKLVYEKALARKAIAVFDEMRMLACEQQEGSDVLEKAMQLLFDLANRGNGRDFIALQDVLYEAFEILDSYHKSQKSVFGLATGLTDIDQMTTGLQNGELILLAGRPSMGKTALAMNIARNAAIDEKVPVGIFSLEMTTIQLVLRMLAAESQIDFQKARAGKLSAIDWQSLSECVKTLDEAKIYINDISTLSALNIRSKARRLKHEKDIGFLVIDYIQLIKSHIERYESQNILMTQISQNLKTIAKELNIPVLALSQLSRDCEKRVNKRPVLSDLRDSGSLEQDADVVMFIYRPEVYRKKGEIREQGLAEIIIAKQRSGPVGTKMVQFKKESLLFRDLARAEMVEESLF